jgi:hypothetical protein
MKPEDTQADLQLGAHIVGVLVRPGSTLRLLAGQPSARPGASAISLLGVAWTMLLLSLWTGGHAPSAVLLPIPRADYYLLEGLAILPVLTGLWWLSSEIAHGIARARGGRGSEPGVRSALGFAYAAPLLFGHVLPELAAYLLGGFEVMALVGRVSLGVAALGVWALSAAALRIAHGSSLGLALGASFAGLFAQAAAGALFIR